MDLSLLSRINEISSYKIIGYVTGIQGLIIECSGISRFLTLGARCKVFKKNRESILAEVISVINSKILLMSFADNIGIGIGCEVHLVDNQIMIFPDRSWIGRVINALAEPLDDKGYLIKGNLGYRLHNSPPSAHRRNMIEDKIDLGIRAINSFLTCSYGQRIGIFAASGVGKSILLSMIAKFADADIKVIGLIGERGREVQELIHKYLGSEGLEKSIIVVSTSDESPLMRRQAAYLVLTISEYFRDLGMKVLCMVDSITRFAIAQREIGISAKEPCMIRGYTPSVFTQLPKLLERAGMGEDSGSITGLFTVLVEGDDNDEPVADNMRAILDGHIVLERRIAEKGRFPAINILRSVSRSMMNVVGENEMIIVNKAKDIISNYMAMEDMIKLGIYKHGTDKELDLSIKYYSKIEKFLSQKPDEYVSIEDSYTQLAEILDISVK